MYLKKINLKNKVALVTGAGKGIGRACSIALAEAGATIIGVSRTTSDLVDLNMKAAFNVAQLVVLKMLKNKKKGGSIINMSSQLGHVGMSGRNIYNMTKFGIEGLTKGMGVELATKNIRVNTVAPTFVETPMVKKFFKNKKFKQLALSNIPMGKVATESDVATAVCFLASDAASMITGTSIVIDGGWTAK